jgi:hypothetical protein
MEPIIELNNNLIKHPQTLKESLERRGEIEIKFKTRHCIHHRGRIRIARRLLRNLCEPPLDEGGIHNREQLERLLALGRESKS